MVGKKIEGEAEEHNKKDYLDTYVFESKHFYGIKSKHTLIPLCIYAVFLLLGLWIVYNRNLTIVKMLSNGCEGIAMFYAGVLIYSSSCGFSTILYKIMADCFQKKYKYELRKGDMNLTYKSSVSFIEFLNF